MQTSDPFPTDSRNLQRRPSRSVSCISCIYIPCLHGWACHIIVEHEFGLLLFLSRVARTRPGLGMESSTGTLVNASKREVKCDVSRTNEDDGNSIV